VFGELGTATAMVCFDSVVSTADLERTSHFPSEMTLSASKPARPHLFKDIGARTSYSLPISY
jgi:hypothetical protein